MHILKFYVCFVASKKIKIAKIMELQFEVTDVTVSFAGYGHWDVTVQIMNLSNYSFFYVSKITTNSIAVDEKDYYTLGKEVLDYNYEDISDVDISYLQNLS